MGLKKKPFPPRRSPKEEPWRVVCLLSAALLSCRPFFRAAVAARVLEEVHEIEKKRNILLSRFLRSGLDRPFLLFICVFSLKKTAKRTSR